MAVLGSESRHPFLYSPSIFPLLTKLSGFICVAEEITDSNIGNGDNCNNDTNVDNDDVNVDNDDNVDNDVNVDNDIDDVSVDPMWTRS